MLVSSDDMRGRALGVGSLAIGVSPFGALLIGALASGVGDLVRAGIPVMGHLGLLPQSVHALGGYRTQGDDESGAARMMKDARALEEAGQEGKAADLEISLIPKPGGRVSVFRASAGGFTISCER